MPRKIMTHLMFDGAAEEAMRVYVALFPGSTIHEMERYGPDGPGAEGSIKLARLTLAGQDLIVIDSPIKHAFTFTPSMSLFVDCESEAELEATFTRLADGGNVLMPLADYGFSARFGWLQDRFGVSWQLNLP
jgi:predicted 3-demethylubiquinone-9 3-methyltransferase (glyoxalase superfamily)